MQKEGEGGSHGLRNPNSGTKCSVPDYKLQFIRKSEPWITLKKNIGNIKYLTSMADISFKHGYAYVDVGSRSYSSSINERSRMDHRLQDAKLMKFSDFFSNLGENLLIEILCRLPSRAAIRLKLVCKNWCSLISSHYFITLFNHRRHDKSLPPIHSPSSGFIFQPHIGLFRFVSSEYSYTYTHRDGFRRLDLSFLPCPQGATIELKASCGDLVLCSTTISHFYVCNLLTKQWAALPPAPQFQFTQGVKMEYGFLCLPAPCSLCTQCVDNSRYNFVVVRFCVYPGWCSEFQVHLFSSREGQWKTLVVPSLRPIMFRYRTYVSLVPYKGMLHWLVSNFILVYDPYNCPEKFSRLINMPTHIRTGALAIRIFQDRLRVTCIGGRGLEFPIHYIWELEDYNMGKWNLVHKIDAKRIPRLSNIQDADLDPKIRKTGFHLDDKSYFYWTDSVG
nr:F-box protein At5g49610-like [Ipomoea batatas]